MSVKLPAYFVRVKAILHPIVPGRFHVRTVESQKWVNLIRLTSLEIYQDEKELLHDKKTVIMGDGLSLEYPLHTFYNNTTKEILVLDVSHVVRH